MGDDAPKNQRRHGENLSQTVPAQRQYDQRKCAQDGDERNEWPQPFAGRVDERQAVGS